MPMKQAQSHGTFDDSTHQYRITHRPPPRHWHNDHLFLSGWRTGSAAWLWIALWEGLLGFEPLTLRIP